MRMLDVPDMYTELNKYLYYYYVDVCMYVTMYRVLYVCTYIQYNTKQQACWILFLYFM